MEMQDKVAVITGVSVVSRDRDDRVVVGDDDADIGPKSVCVYHCEPDCPPLTAQHCSIICSCREIYSDRVTG